MGYIFWICVGLGFWFGDMYGALIGAAIGYVLQAFVEPTRPSQSHEETYNRNETYHYSSSSQREEQRASSLLYTGGTDYVFVNALMVMASYVIQADGRIMHSEMEFVRRFVEQSFGYRYRQHADDFLRSIFEVRKQEGQAAYQRLVRESIQLIVRAMPEEHRFQLVVFLCDIAKADGRIDPGEVAAVKELAVWLGVSAAEVDAMLSLGGESLDDAYRVLEISPDATDEEVRKAYRRLALKYHPDRVATLGEEVQQAAHRKFQELGAAKERIYKARGMR